MGGGGGWEAFLETLALGDSVVGLRKQVLDWILSRSKGSSLMGCLNTLYRGDNKKAGIIHINKRRGCAVIFVVLNGFFSAMFKTQMRRDPGWVQPHWTQSVFCEHWVLFILRWEHQGLADSTASFHFLIDKKNLISKFGKIHTHTRIYVCVCMCITPHMSMYIRVCMMCLYDRNQIMIY